MSAQEFESLEAFKSWVVENKSKLWEYNSFNDEFQKKNQENIDWPVVGKIYIKPLSDTHIGVLFFIKSTPASWNSPEDYLIEFYYCQLTISKKFDLVVSYKSHEADFWNRYFKLSRYNLFVYNPDSFNFLNWNGNPFEVKS